MANGLFLGGFAKGAKTASDMGVNEGTLQLQQQQEMNRQSRLDAKEAQDAISSTLGVVSDVITNAKASGASNEKINQIIAPLMKDIETISRGSGIDPSRFVNSVNATISTAQSNLPGDKAVQEIQGKERAAQELAKITGIDIDKARQEIGLISPPEKGAGGTGDGTGLSKTTIAKLEKDTIATGRVLDALNQAASSYEDKFLRYRGKFDYFVANQADKIGVASEDQKRFIKEYTGFEKTVEQLFNAYRKEITGAAAAVKELDRLKRSILNVNNGPTEFRAALDQFRSFANNQLEQNKATLSGGLQERGPDTNLPDANLPQQRIDVVFTKIVDEAKAALAAGKSRAGIEEILKNQGIDPRVLDQ